MTRARKTRCSIARCSFCSWVEVFFGTDMVGLKLRAVLEEVFDIMTMNKNRHWGL